MVPVIQVLNAEIKEVMLRATALPDSASAVCSKPLNVEPTLQSITTAPTSKIHVKTFLLSNDSFHKRILLPVAYPSLYSITAAQTCSYSIKKVDDGKFKSPILTIILVAY